MFHRELCLISCCLRRWWAEIPVPSTSAGQGFFRRHGLVYRRYQTPGTDELIEQLVLPIQCRPPVLKLAHDIRWQGTSVAVRLPAESCSDSIGRPYSKTSPISADLAHIVKSLPRRVIKKPQSFLYLSLMCHLNASPWTLLVHYPAAAREINSSASYAIMLHAIQTQFPYDGCRQSGEGTR